MVLIMMKSSWRYIYTVCGVCNYHVITHFLILKGLYDDMRYGVVLRVCERCSKHTSYTFFCPVYKQKLIVKQIIRLDF